MLRWEAAPLLHASAGTAPAGEGAHGTQAAIVMGDSIKTPAIAILALHSLDLCHESVHWVHDVPSCVALEGCSSTVV